MLTGKNDVPLREGDLVYVPCVVKRLFPEGRRLQVELETTEAGTDGLKNELNLSAGQIVKPASA